MSDPVNSVSHETFDGDIETIAGYRLVKLVGRGGMGSVYKAVAPDGQVRAIKILGERLHRNNVLLARFHREAETAIRLEHRNIVRGYAYGEENNRHYFIMEYISGATLLRLLQKRGALPEKTAIEIAVALANGLHSAHQMGVIHRDVKPDNILIDTKGCVKLTDLGLVKSLDDEKVRQDLTVTGSGLGTHQYMPPEQFDDAKNASPQFDVYSLGATLYTMVTGQLPFSGNGAVEVFVNKTKGKYMPPERINARLSDRTLYVIRASLSPEPSERPQTAREFAELLAGLRPLPNVANARSNKSDNQNADVAEPFWYVVFYAKDGKRQKCKGTRKSIEREIGQGRIPRQAYISRDRYGQYRPLTRVPEFADALKKTQKPKMNPLKRLFSSVSVSMEREDPVGQKHVSPNDTDVSIKETSHHTQDDSVEERPQSSEAERRQPGKSSRPVAQSDVMTVEADDDMDDKEIVELLKQQSRRTFRRRAFLWLLLLIVTSAVAGAIYWWSQQ